MKQTTLQDYTKLQIREVHYTAKIAPSVLVDTPHKGLYEIELRNSHYSLLGPMTQTDKNAGKIIGELMDIEDEAKKYLLDKWIEEQNYPEQK